MELLRKLGIEEMNFGATTGTKGGRIEATGPKIKSYSPIDGKPIATIIQAGPQDYETLISKAQEAFVRWRKMPGPSRGAVVRQIADALRIHKRALGRLVSLEVGKIQAEGEGEVQEMIDIADFAVGLSRQLYGLTMASERPRHRMFEQWHPLGPVGVITSFNFPVAVWSWNAFIASVCGDVVVWKPSSKSALCALAVQNLIDPILDAHDLSGVFTLVIGSGRDIGELLINDRRIPLISATGSCAMGRKVGQTVAARLGRSILELGGNNAIIIAEDADLDLALRAVVFGAVGTAGQRCTSTRRVIVHRSVKDRFLGALADAYAQVKVGDPLEQDVLMGPLIDKTAVDVMMNTLQMAEAQGGRIAFGGKRVAPAGLEGGHYVQPTIIEADRHLAVMGEETFAPILYVVAYDTIEEAIQIHNGVDQGLSSAIFTDSLRYSEAFLSHEGSDCGIANVNIGTSGAEIGGAFGGEKDTGGGREAGSDAWKAYMRRQTNTINWSGEMPLAQGIRFDISPDG